MRHIDLNEVRRNLPADWDDRAKRALEELRAAAPDERKSVLSRRDIWRRLASALADVSHKKCWYCETQELRSDDPVDHFRPKAGVEECGDHPGYWWLAFEWRNLRLSCTYCNSRRRDDVTGETGGKQNSFPLVDPAMRAYGEADDLTREYPKLLDPTEHADTTLLWFREDGMADAGFDEASRPTQHDRVRTSIKAYFLNHTDLVEARIELFQRVRRLVRHGGKCFEDWSSGDEASKDGYDLAVGELRTLRDAKAKFSTAAKHMINSLSEDEQHRWLQRL